MIFEKDSPIDDNLLDITKRLKQLTKKKPLIQWVPDRETWILTVPDYLSTKLVVSYHWISKNKFEIFVEIWSELRSIGSYETAKEAADFISIFWLMEKGISLGIIDFLAKELKNGVSLKNAVDRITTETTEEISLEQMEILGIDYNQRGRVLGRKFDV